jgi:hypothetical protein
VRARIPLLSVVVVLASLGSSTAANAPLPEPPRISSTAPTFAGQPGQPGQPGPSLAHEAGDTGDSGTTESRSTGGDEPDVVTGNQTHVVYFVPQGKPDENLDANGGPLMKAVDSLRAWFARETASSGQPAIRPRFDRRTDGYWDASFVRGTKPASEYSGINDIRDDLIAQGYNKANKRYLVYAALSAGSPANEGGLCGESYYALPGFANRPYSVVYLDANPGCGSRDFGDGTAGGAGKSETIAAHEWLHNEGITPPAAPRHCASSLYHVCTGPLWAIPHGEPANLGRLDPEATDLMFPLIWRKLANMFLDLERNDYLDHGMPWTNLRDSAWMN